MRISPPSAASLRTVALVLAVLAYRLGTRVLVSGYLGAEARQRSIAQIDSAGSLILGGRPEIAATVADIRSALAQVTGEVPVAEAASLIGLAGSVTTVAAIALALEAYDADRIHLSRIAAADVADVASRLLAMTRAERAALPVMHPGRVDVIGAGALVLATLVDRLGLADVVVSEADILDGIAWSAAARSGP